MISALSLVVLSVSCFCGSVASAGAVRRDAVAPAQYKPDVISLYADYRNNQYFDATYDVFVETSDLSATAFDFGYNYAPVELHISYESEDYSVWGVRFARFTGSTGISYGDSVCPNGIPWSFTPWTTYSSSNSYYYLYQYGSAIVPINDRGTWSRSDYSVKNYMNAVQYTFTSSTSGPYYVYFQQSPIADFFSKLADYYFNLYAPIGNNAYNQGKADGKEEGKAEGLAQGRQEGYQQAVDENEALSPNGVVYGLFGALVNVPVSIFNGLTPLVIWNTPIISIILTFFAVGLVLWVVKKVI